MLTSFSSRQDKIKYLGSSTDLITTAFAEIAVAILYRLDKFSTNVAAPLRVTAGILAGIYSGNIVYWNDTLIQQANMENKASLPFKKIKVVAQSVPSDTNSVFFR